MSTPTDLKNYKSNDITEIVNNLVAVIDIIAIIGVLAWMGNRDREDYQQQIATHYQCEPVEQLASVAVKL